jgi:hypothetical protein
MSSARLAAGVGVSSVLNSNARTENGVGFGEEALGGRRPAGGVTASALAVVVDVCLWRTVDRT